MSRTGQTDPFPLRPKAMSLDEARQVIACWLDSIQTVDPIDLTEERFDAAIASDERLNEAFDTSLLPQSSSFQRTCGTDV